MSLANLKLDSSKFVELTTFYMGDLLFGIDISHVVEINRLLDITPVPQAPEYVLGVMNLRGKIVTVIDLGRKNGLGSTEISKKTRNLIVNSQNEPIGLLVDRVADVVFAEAEKLLPPPSNVQGIHRKYLKGVYQTEKGLIAVLDVEEVLKDEE